MEHMFAASTSMTTDLPRQKHGAPLSNRMHRRLSRSNRSIIESHESCHTSSKTSRKSRTRCCQRCPCGRGLCVHSFCCCYLRQILTQFILVQFIGVSIRMITSPHLYQTQPCPHNARQLMTG